MNYDNSWYPTWSTGENNSFNKVNDMNPVHGHEMRDLNVSEMQVWDPSDSWIQHDVYKAGHETDSLNSGGEYSSDSTPAWASNPVDWDHDSATRLAQKLLQVQMETTGTESMDPFSTMDEAGNKDVSSFSPLTVQQPGKTGHFVSPTSTAGGNPRFKTEFCRNFREKGDCVYGNQCQFAHGKAELRHDTIRNSKYKTKLCQKYWIHGWCAYGTRCNFIHQEDENQTIKSRQPVPGNNAASSNLTGFRPLVANSGLRALRKSSESSGDSGIESGYYKNVTEMASFKKPEVPVEFGGNKMAESSFNGNNGWASIKGTGDMNGCGKDLLNIDLSSELNRNFYLDVVRMKESREVPHPEDNPIPTPMVNFPRNQQITSQYRMMKEAGNMWAY